ncbi:MAG TPA: alpha/beta hydrolase [Longimicrobium sp.]|nr:alpha/beta hydrolase [Longimicrobium sp.]
MLLVVAGIAGAIYEGGARRRATRAFPPPGAWVDIGGRRIQLDCRGSRSPTVVLEAGLDHFGSLSWDAVHDAIAHTTRVCAYSRAGMMWSDATDDPFDSEGMAKDLRAALNRAGERSPWVMVGHSMGGPYVMTFTAHYPREVAGLVFVDAAHPDQEARMRSAPGTAPSLFQRAKGTAMEVAGPPLVRMGAGRLVPVPPGLPTWTPEMLAAHRAYFATSAAALLKEARAAKATLRTAGRHRRLGARPLVVLTAAAPMSSAARERTGLTPEQDARRLAAWTRLHQDQATWSTRARHEIVDDAAHYIQLDRPDVVIRAVREVVAAVRESYAPPDQRPGPRAEEAVRR